MVLTSGFVIAILLVAVQANNISSTSPLQVSRVALAGHNLSSSASDLLAKHPRGLNRPSSVHDLRTTLRRLSVTSQTFSHISSMNGKASERALRHAVHSIGTIRDADILSGLSEKVCSAAGPSTKDACSLLDKQIAVQRTSGMAEFSSQRDELLAACKQLRERFVDNGTVFYDAATQCALIGSYSREVLLSLHSALSAFHHAMRTHGIRDDEPTTRMHSVRKAVKNLRYTLEPMVGTGSQAHHVLAQMQRLQTSLGDLHDWSVFAQTLHEVVGTHSRKRLQSAYIALSDVVAAEQSKAEDEFIVDWLTPLNNGTSTSSRTGIDELLTSTAELIESSMPIRDSNSNRLEVERRWFLTALPTAISDWLVNPNRSKKSPSLPHSPPLPHGSRLKYMEQGYIPGDKLQERLRRTVECAHSQQSSASAEGSSSASASDGAAAADDEDDVIDCRLCATHNFNFDAAAATSSSSISCDFHPSCACRQHFYRTLKSGQGLSRLEIEEEVGAPLFYALWGSTEGLRVSKRRFVIPATERAEGVPAFSWEIDEVLSGNKAGRVILDIELKFSDGACSSSDGALATPPFPEWLAPFVAEEVTETFSSAMLVGL